MGHKEDMDAAMDLVEQSIQAYNTARLSDPEHNRHGKGDVVIDWVVGYTVSNVIEVEGSEVVGYANLHIAPLGNPNAHVGLAQWVAEDINEILHPDNDD
jgi:hypothetical protein